MWAGDIPRFLSTAQQLPAPPDQPSGVFIDVVPMMHWRSARWKRIDDVHAPTGREQNPALASGLETRYQRPDVLPLPHTRYLPAEQQPQLWLLAMENLNNSEDVAAIAEFYQQNPQARDVLKPEWRQLKRCINEACGAEIERTDDPDHLNHVLADLYRIEDALDLDMKPLIQDIYFTLDSAGMDLNDGGLAGEFAPV